MAHIPDLESVETVTIVVRALITVLAFSSFLYFRHKKARLSFQAWALFATVLYAGLLYNVFLTHDLIHLQFGALLSLFLFLNSLIVIVRLWEKSRKVDKTNSAKTQREDHGKQDNYKV